MSLTRLAFLQVNDLHGYLEPHGELLRGPDGMPQRHSVIAI